MLRAMVEGLPGSQKVKRFVIRNSPKNLNADEFLARNHTKRLSSEFASIRKQPFAERELTDFLDQLKRCSLAVSSSSDSAHHSRKTSVVSAALEVTRDEAPTTVKTTTENLEATRVVQPAERLAAPPTILTPGEERQGGDPLRLGQPQLPTESPQNVERQRPPQDPLPPSPPSPLPPSSPSSLPPQPQQQFSPPPLIQNNHQTGLYNFIGHSGNMSFRIAEPRTAGMV